ncbi:MAG: hypothetical protein ACRD37_03915, partial [Candidatus Acidiferrales bacterium]
MRNPDHWNRRNVSEALCSTLSFLSEDDYEFEFEKVTNPIPMQKYLELSDADSSAAFKADEVLLFSGGPDSLSGAVEELSANGKRVPLMSHRASPKMYDHQKASRYGTDIAFSTEGHACAGSCDDATNTASSRIYAAIAVVSLRCARLC